MTARQIDLLTATGFLRMAADGTGSGDDSPASRNQVVTDTLKIIGTSLFGLSIHCAQCHDHRYDPIPQTDYYALRAVFEPALDWNHWKSPDARLVSLYTAADHQRAEEVEAEAEVVVQKRAQLLADYLQQALDTELAKFDEPLRQSLREAYQTPADQRSEQQKQLLAANPSVNITPGNLYQYIPESKPKLAEFDERIKQIRAKKPVHEFLRALVEPAGHAPETRLFHRGDHGQPKQVIQPAALSVVATADQRAVFPADDESVPTTGRRLALARWLTSRDNPLFARVIANRIWMHHFGDGLVSTPADFGKLGAAPTNPELLDWLASELISNGWSLKRLQRRIMASTTYRQSVAAADDGSSVPRTVRRLEAETIRDRMLVATGTLDRSMFGQPLSITADDAGQVIVGGDQPRRSIYIQARRTQPVALLQTFDAPVMETNCEARTKSTVATQSLMLMNGQFTLEQAARLADRAAREPSDLDPAWLGGLPIPRLPAGPWRYGMGRYDEQSDRVIGFTTLPHWTGRQYQGGPTLPDPALGYALLNADGGHPDTGSRSVIRRWTATADGLIQISGSLAHPSKHGDGVRGTIVSSRTGAVGQWEVAHGATETELTAIPVRTGDTIDFVTDCRQSVTSDSFTWQLTLTIRTDGQPPQTIRSVDQFGGPVESTDSLPGQVDRAWQLTYGRRPTSDELGLALKFIADQFETFAALPTAVPAGKSRPRQAMTNLCQLLLSSNEFLYVE